MRTIKKKQKNKGYIPCYCCGYKAKGAPLGVPYCEKCSIMQGDMTISNFIKQCKKVSEMHKFS